MPPDALARSLAADLAHTLGPDPERRARPGVASPLALGGIASRKWHRPPHLELLDRHLVDLAAGRIRRLLVLAPPRHGKSELCSHLYSAWLLGRYPNKRIILCSYETDFATSWGRKVRDTLSEWGPRLFGVSVRQDASAAHRFEVAGFAGGMICVGAGGAITGRGADLLIVDDPVKNLDDVAQLSARDRLWEWWQSVPLTRLEPGGAMVVVMTRWHEDDLAGRILTNDAESQHQDWTVLRLAALAEEDDPLGRVEGEALWPQRYPRAELESLRRRVGSRVFESLYQGRPRPVEGALFKRDDFRYFTEVEDGYDLGGRIVTRESCSRFCAVDPAVSTKTSADYTVVGVFEITDRKELLVLDIVRKHLEGPEQITLLKNIYEKHRPESIFVEGTAYQLALLQHARREGLPIREIKPDRDKVSRATVAAARLEAGDVYFRRGTEWLANFEDELLGFPRGRYDDQVDVLAYAALEAIGHRRVRVARARLVTIGGGQPQGTVIGHFESSGFSWTDRSILGGF